MTIARAHLIEPSVTRWYHCVTRCVRRAFLLGEGTDDRKLWIDRAPAQRPGRPDWKGCERAGCWGDSSQAAGSDCAMWRSAWVCAGCPTWPVARRHKEGRDALITSRADSEAEIPRAVRGNDGPESPVSARNPSDSHVTEPLGPVGSCPEPLEADRITVGQHRVGFEPPQRTIRSCQITELCGNRSNSALAAAISGHFSCARRRESPPDARIGWNLRRCARR